MHFVTTTLNFAWLVYYRIQWENSRRPETFGHHCMLKSSLLTVQFMSQALNLCILVLFPARHWISGFLFVSHALNVWDLVLFPGIESLDSRSVPRHWISGFLSFSQALNLWILVLFCSRCPVIGCTNELRDGDLINFSSNKILKWCRTLCFGKLCSYHTSFKK